MLLCRGAYAAWKASKAWRDTIKEFRRAAAAASDPSQGSRHGFGNQTAQPPRKKKKIDPAVGEYIHFEEVSTTTATEDAGGSKTTTATITEQQIVDVQWEDIPEK